MPRFRSSRSQASHAVTQKIALGKGRHENRDDGLIHSVGTARGYEQALKSFVDYIQNRRLGDLFCVTVEVVKQYLSERAAIVTQKTLDLDRQAIQMHYGMHLDVIKSKRKTQLSSRRYTPEQVARIAGAQSRKNKLATQIAYNAGLRAHELLTIRPVSERQASDHREWSINRFYGRQGVIYTVKGKGGLIREVILKEELAIQLEANRLAKPRNVTDRGVHYVQFYDLGGGRTWSQSFTSASKRELGFSVGAHGLRHSYVQERMRELQNKGMLYNDAKGVVAQEVGHFDRKTTGGYLR